MRYEPQVGQDISNVAVHVTTIAKELNESVEFSFNSIELVALPHTTPEVIVEAYHAEQDQLKADAVSESEKLKNEAATYQTLIAQAPIQMAIKDEEKWKSYLQNNNEPYGKRVLSYAHDWARLMERAVVMKGQTVEECADETSHIADYDGITGFMHGAAVKVLVDVWYYGDALKEWHNAKHGVPGDKGVINPAVFSIGTN